MNLNQVTADPIFVESRRAVHQPFPTYPGGRDAVFSNNPIPSTKTRWFRRARGRGLACPSGVGSRESNNKLAVDSASETGHIARQREPFL
jgi:hypothetical protein